MTRYLVARANFLLFGVMVIILLVVGGITWDGFNAARSARSWSEHSYEVIFTLKDLGMAIRNAETGQRGFLLTGKEDYLTPYREALDRVSLLQGDLQRLTADSSAEQDRLRTLSPLLQRKLEELAQTIELRRTVGLDAATRVVGSDVGRDYMRQIEAILAAMSADQQKLLGQRLDETERRGSVLRGLVVGGTLLAICVLVWAAWLLNQAWRQSSRMEAEQRLLAIRLKTSLESLSQGIAVFNSDWLLTNWNSCFQELLHLPQDLLHAGTAYRSFSGINDKEGAPLLEKEEQIRHGGQGEGQTVTFERRVADGRELEVRRSPMPDGGFVLTITDMTKRAHAEGVLREAQKMQAVGQLTGGIAHDFNNLLTVILGNLEIVHAKLTGEGALQTRIERAIWGAQRGATLTNQLLAFARKQPLAPSPLDLSENVPSLIPLLQRTLGEHIDVRFVGSAGLWLAMADAAQLESAVLNLALNARDAMPGGGRLTIELANSVLDDDYARHHAEVTPGEYVMLAVSDTGHGMTPDVMARAIEPFFTTKADGNGTGLGLAMVFGFIKQSGGHLKIYSEPDEGTTVRLYLPRARAKDAGRRRLTAPIELPGGTATVLVVEDEAAVREISVAILRDLGYGVLEASDGDSGWRIFQENAETIDLVLTDVVLPGKLRSRQMVEKIGKLRPEVRILYMSGYTENAIVHHGRLDEGVELISKPFKREQLAKRVAEMMSAPSAVDGANGPTVVEMPQRPR